MKIAQRNHNRFNSLLSTLIIVGAISGCSGIHITGKDGSIHHLIIGIGVVSTPKNNSKYGVLASKTQVIGVHVSSQPGLKVGAGYSSSSSVLIPDDSENVLVEITQTPFGQLSIEANPHVTGDSNEK